MQTDIVGIIIDLHAPDVLTKEASMETVEE